MQALCELRHINIIEFTLSKMANILKTRIKN